MKDLNIRLAVRNAIERCKNADGIDNYHYYSIAFVLEKDGNPNPDLLFIYGAVNKDVDDVAVYDEAKLVEDISYEDFCEIASIIHEEYEANFETIISNVLLDITKQPNTYEGLLNIVKIRYEKKDFSRDGIGFRISFEIKK